MKQMKVLEKVKVICEEIQKRDGVVTPQSLVREASPLDSPIHNRFNWNDEEAAEQYRLWQARELIKRVVITYEKLQVAGYHNVTITKEGVVSRGYVSTAVIMDSEDLRRQVIQGALKELLYWQGEYKTYTELENLINQKEMALLTQKYV